MNKYDYSRDTLEKLVKNSNSIAEVAHKLGMLGVRGAKWGVVKKKIIEYNIDYSHFGAHSNKAVDISEYLSNKRSIMSSKLKQKLFALGIKENKCEICGISEWNGKPIMCALHHIDGNNQNNSLENLQILCPNCHSQTENYAGRNAKINAPKKKKTKEEMSKIHSKVSSRPRFDIRKVKRPSTYEEFKKEFAALNYNFCAMGRKYGVSDQAIRKWIKCYKKYGE